VRDERKTLTVIEELEIEMGQTTHYLHLDLASLKSESGCRDLSAVSHIGIRLGRS
jgi:hypothetical protein